MRNILFIFIVFNIISSCKSGENNVELTAFTKELILMYLNDSENSDAKEMKDDIIVECSKDSLYFYMSVFAVDHNSKQINANSLIANTILNGHKILILGIENSIFYKLKIKQKRLENSSPKIIEPFDPNIWEVCLNREDSSFCMSKSYKTNDDEDITPIQNLAIKYFKIENSKPLQE